ncbi:MAG: F0F1 ATP synthase subunit B [Cyanobacteria bacterium J06641_5]
MLFDPKTVLFQLVNFLSLVAVLYLVLYGPIAQAMQTRRDRLAVHWQMAQDERQQAETEKISYQRQRLELEEQREEFLVEARQEAERLRQQLALEARQEVDRLKASWQQALVQEQLAFSERLQQQLAARVQEIARRSLRDLADADLEDRTIAVFLRHLRDLDVENRNLLAGNAAEMTLSSSFELSPAARRQIAAALQAAGIAEGEALRFATTPELIFGIELQTRDGELGWNAKNYLRSLETEVKQLIASQQLAKGQSGEDA